MQLRPVWYILSAFFSMHVCAANLPQHCPPDKAFTITQGQEGVASHLFSTPQAKINKTWELTSEYNQDWIIIERPEIINQYEPPSETWPWASMLPEIQTTPEQSRVDVNIISNGMQDTSVECRYYTNAGVFKVVPNNKKIVDRGASSFINEFKLNNNIYKCTTTAPMTTQKCLWYYH